MSNEPKKYPPDTPVTLEILADLMWRIGNPIARNIIKDSIQLPQPEPKEGELWLCKNCEGYMAAMWRLSGDWSFWSDGAGKFVADPIPIKRLIPPEDQA